KKLVSQVAALTKHVARHRQRTQFRCRSRLQKLIPVNSRVRPFLPSLCLSPIMKPELSSFGFRLRRHRRTHRRGWRCFARFSSDPRTLTLGVCPFAGTSGLQPFSWINENNLPFITYLILALTFRTAQAGDNGSAVREGRLSLDEVTSGVLANNPAIKAAQEKWRAMKARVPQAAAWEDLRAQARSRVARYVSIPPNAFTDQSFMLQQEV